MTRLLASLAAAATALPALSHDGHGLDGAHWHATDVVGFALVGVIAFALWWSRRK